MWFIWGNKNHFYWQRWWCNISSHHFWVLYIRLIFIYWQGRNIMSTISCWPTDITIPSSFLYPGNGYPTGKPLDSQEDAFMTLTHPSVAAPVTDASIRGWTSAIPVKIKEYAKKFPLQDHNTKQFIAWVVPNELLFPYGEWNAICNRSCGEWWCGCSKQPSVYFLNSKSFKCFHLMAETTRLAWI